MGNESNFSTAAPPGDFPLMRVGVNNPFRFNHELFRENFGPPVTGKTPTPSDFWRNIAPSGLDKLKELGVTLVRLFILQNAYNYGPDPVEVTRARILKQCQFDPPEDEKTLYPFFEHFELMLDAFRRVGGIQVMPSVIDFQAFIERTGETPPSKKFGRRADLIRYPKKRDLFI